tara:strand:- start:216 stop:320 length:105 start_codon:yes stop_codon:yes gene_type:complete
VIRILVIPPTMVKEIKKKRISTKKLRRIVSLPST